MLSHAQLAVLLRFYFLCRDILLDTRICQVFLVFTNYRIVWPQNLGGLRAQLRLLAVTQEED